MRPSHKSLSELRARLESESLRVYEAERRAVLNLDMEMIEGVLKVCFAFFWVLYSLDAALTLLALRHLPGFFERNWLFAPLVLSGFEGVALAIVMKFAYALPLALMVFYAPRFGSELRYRILKLGALAGLVIIIPFYAYVVITNNLSIILALILV